MLTLLILTMMPLDKPGSPGSWPPQTEFDAPAPPVPHDFKFSPEEWAARCPARVSHEEMKARGLKFVAKLQPAPRYPREMLDREREGKVDLATRVDAAGVVVDVQLLRTTDPAFVYAAAGAVWKWRYDPLMLDGKPTCVDDVVGISFRLR
jgi:TonB family protein